MKSRITIEVDFENNNTPFIQLLRRNSSDVRDSLVSKFIENLGHHSTWCSIQYDNEYEDEQGKCQRWKIKPVIPNKIPQEMRLMAELIGNEMSPSIYLQIPIEEELPPLNKFVTTIDEAGEHRVYRRTEHGWNMRDMNGINSPNDNKKIIYWLKELQLLHIIPINDLEEHEESSTCKCGPSVIEENGELIIVHNSFDGREGIEIVNEILNQSK